MYPFLNTGLYRHTHLEYAPIRKSEEGENHVSPEHHEIRSFGEIQVPEQEENSGLHEEQQREFVHVACKRH